MVIGPLKMLCIDGIVGKLILSQRGDFEGSSSHFNAEVQEFLLFSFLS